MDDMKRFSKCKTDYSKSSFHKSISNKDYLHSHCTFCRKQKKRISDEKSGKKENI